MANLAEKLETAPVRVSAVRATSAHVKYIAERARVDDVRELASGWRATPERALRHGLEHSSHVWTGLANFRPFCMVGVVPASVLSGAGLIWLVATDEVLEHQVAFLRRSRTILARMQAVYEILENDVAADNPRAIGWLQWLGFKLSPARPFGAGGAMFHHFEWRREQDV